ncbi:MAG: glycosyltransferase family 2 protein [Ferruginibacter sp.]
MIFLKLILWASIFILFYSYLGYGMILWLYLKVREKKEEFIYDPRFEPDVSLVIAAFNEEEFIEEKILNCLALDYPREKLKILFVADGSVDDTVAIISRFPQVQLLFSEKREGKIAAVNRAMKYINTPFVVFCDANTLLNKECIKELIKHYQDENIGAVAGEKKISTGKTGDAAGSGEGLYWKYESFLKKLDARFYTVVGAAGELFSLRTHLYEPVAKNILLDDFILSMEICLKGYRVMYEPKAFASEAPSFSMKEEQKRKIRISAGGFQSVLILKQLLNIFRYGKLSFQYISHRVLRWVVCPVLLPLLFIANLMLCYFSDDNFYIILMCLQILFYLAAATGWMYASRNIKIKLLYVPYYFVFMNAALYMGFSRFINNKQSVLWEKARRK